MHCLTYEYIKLFDGFENLRIRNDIFINELKIICKENDEIIAFMKEHMHHRFLEVKKDSKHANRLVNLEKNYIRLEERIFNEQKMSMKNDLIKDIKQLSYQIEILGLEIIKMNNEFNYLNEICDNIFKLPF